jgi:tRNA threonylcarbamoyladenosine biosynthesis protein TsaE
LFIISSFSIDIREPVETERFGSFIGHHLRGGEVVFLTGELGAGKTTLAQSIAASMGIPDVVSSPTFNVVKEYMVPNSDLMLAHADMYRLETAEDLLSVGLTEYLGNSKTVSIIEWPEKITALEETPHIHISMSLSGQDRHLVVEQHGQSRANENLMRSLDDNALS